MSKPERIAERRGHILRSYHVVRGYCDGERITGARSAAGAWEEARARGWCRTRAYGWTCNDCLDEVGMARGADV